MNIDEILKQAGDYFKEKIINGDCEIIAINPSNATASIKIDQKHTFDIWIANEPGDHFKIYTHRTTGMDKNMEPFLEFTKKQRIAAWEKMEPKLTEYRNTVLRAKKIKELATLKNELEN